MELMRAHSEWANRLADERHEDLSSLYSAVLGRKNLAQEMTIPLNDLRFSAPDQETLALETRFSKGTFTNWSFGQLTRQIGAPPGYLASLPANLAADCLNAGLKSVGDDRVKVLSQDTPGEDTQTYRAFTGESYGRIWDSEVVELAQRIVDRSGGQFFNPKEWSGKGSGLYASDRDVFVFLINGGSIVDGGTSRDQLHRGFFLWNSETGSKTFGLDTFLFRAVCGNHQIFGGTDVRSLKIRHSKFAPGRLESEALPILLEYSQSSALGEEEKIRKAQEFLLPAPEKTLDWFTEKGFSRSQARGAIAYAQQEEGDCRTLWQAIQGLTRFSQTYINADIRDQLDRQAGKLMDLVG